MSRPNDNSLSLIAANDNLPDLEFFDSGAPVVVLYALVAIVAAILLWS